MSELLECELGQKVQEEDRVSYHSANHVDHRPTKNFFWDGSSLVPKREYIFKGIKFSLFSSRFEHCYKE